MEPSNCKMPTPSPRLLPLHRNGPRAVTCPGSQHRGTGSAACTCPGTFTICIPAVVRTTTTKEGSRLQKSASGKPTEQAQEAKAAVLPQGLSTLSAPGPSLPNILSPRRRPQPQPFASATWAHSRTLPKAGARTGLLCACRVGDTEYLRASCP